jgi:hypothetical protein
LKHGKKLGWSFGEDGYGAACLLDNPDKFENVKE